MENIVIFKIELRWETGGFAQASNFISKMKGSTGNYNDSF